MRQGPFTWYEFFAGGGMARLGLGSRWECVFANEWCEKKAASYRAKFGASRELEVKDVAKLTIADIPGRAELCWASFPCQDLSLAGSWAGLRGERSGTFSPFWKLVEGLAKESRAPRLVVLENVVGTLTSHRGRDFSTIVSAMAHTGYRTGAMVIDAVHFLPQSRPRLFIVGVFQDTSVPDQVQAGGPSKWHPRSLIGAHAQLPALPQEWIWWALPMPRARVPLLSSLIEPEPQGVSWHTPEQTQHLLSLMSPLNRKKVQDAQSQTRRCIGTVYKRTRPDAAGNMVQRAEVRFDEISGCLRTPAGGSSRQVILEVEGSKVRSRLLSGREAARLMGVPDSYPLPEKYNQAYHLFGDGVAVPVVAWLEAHLLRPIVSNARNARTPKHRFAV
jgi:DNA (cytosine-5)-methyltransferase 1